tara:strand:- start:858 stop:1154 length:297 start_codon:yes stop_codon:yes gene_type:complete
MKYKTDSPFMAELQEGRTMNVNGNPMPTAIWNLLISKRDLTMWTRKFKDGRPMKMKPHRHWKVTDVKKYFGITGIGDKLLANFMALYDDVMGKNEEDE